ncbi:hypothetical protein BSU04_22115 [Caballeronia sordidicola]|uniref:Uncharacterized protein n=1 Tax=Caballeronia sordidicola TaxID=196367 RepID=A0A226WYV5_CABSO|nr:hypothetical protein BSU04_22115 [Caballeronia sordidicola]
MTYSSSLTKRSKRWVSSVVGYTSHNRDSPGRALALMILA